MIAIDLCCGTKSATQSFLDAGWKIVTVDANPSFLSDICADITTIAPGAIYSELNDPRAIIDFIWASPPCTEFAREFMPWSKTGNVPDMSVVVACRDIIRSLMPTYWCIENVRGAMSWFRKIGLGAPRQIIGPFHLWGNFPQLPFVDASKFPSKERMSSGASTKRGMIPAELSRAMFDAVVSQDRLFMEVTQ